MQKGIEMGKVFASFERVDYSLHVCFMWATQVRRRKSWRRKVPTVEKNALIHDKKDFLCTLFIFHKIQLLDEFLTDLSCSAADTFLNIYLVRYVQIMLLSQFCLQEIK